MQDDASNIAHINQTSGRQDSPQVNAKEADVNKQINQDAIDIELDEQSNVATVAMLVVALGAFGIISTIF